eukprot:SAG25_NODE_4969_length_722_cov_0.746388_1_plen_86_part_10
MALWFIVCALLILGGAFSLQAGKEHDNDCLDEGHQDEERCQESMIKKRRVWTSILKVLVPGNIPGLDLGLDKKNQTQLSDTQRSHN